MNRNDRGDVNGEIYSVEDASYENDERFESETSPYVEFSSARPKRGRPLLVVGSFIAVVILGVAGYFIFSHLSKGNDALKIQGKVAMSADELQSVVLAKHLTIYWAGPVTGAKYALIDKPGASFVRYLPNGQGLNDATTSYRVIATYVQKGAFLVTQSAGSVSGNVGFTNADGNAVFYVKTRPTNVYMGIKDKDIQIEIFDPGIDQSLGLSLIHNQIQQIA